MNEFPAKFVVFWPGQEVYACQKHADALDVLNRAIGGGPLSRREESGHECSNCKNEALNSKGASDG